MPSTKTETMHTNFTQNKLSIFRFPNIDGFFLLTEIILKISRHFPIIIFSLASLKLLLVVNDIYSNNIGFAILNSLFAIGDFIFLGQLYQRRKVYQKQSYFPQSIGLLLMDDNLK